VTGRMLTSCAQSCEECTAPRASVCSVLLRIAPGSHTPRLISSFARGLACALRRSSAQRQAKHRETKRSRSRFHSLVTSCDRGVSSDSGQTDTEPGERSLRANKSVVHLIYDLPENCCGNAQQTATGCDLFRGGSPWRRASSFLPSGERKKAVCALAARDRPRRVVGQQAPPRPICQPRFILPRHSLLACSGGASVLVVVVCSVLERDRG
jgi:hypothetical protein